MIVLLRACSGILLEIDPNVWFAVLNVNDFGETIWLTTYTSLSNFINKIDVWCFCNVFRVGFWRLFFLNIWSVKKKTFRAIFVIIMFWASHPLTILLDSLSYSFNRSEKKCLDSSQICIAYTEFGEWANE